jgi:hypothetical protein
MTDDINRIIIGLGGQGSRIVNAVRNEVLAHGPIPAGIEFLAIDSDRLSLEQLDSVPSERRIYLPAPDDAITEAVVPWLPREFRPKAGGGCGMQRLTGKAMYLVHRTRILEAIRESARALRQRTQSTNVMVVLVNAFGGGTGSGMLIDFALDIRQEITELTGQEPLLFGIGVLPSRSETIQRANGVALLKELHFLLSQKERRVLGGRDFSNPFELYFLVGREVMGIERDDELLAAVVRFAIDLGLIPTASKDTAGAGKGAGWVDLQDIRTLVKGAGHMFATFGYYRARFPAETLLQYFAILDRADAIRRRLTPLEAERETAQRRVDDRKVSLSHAEEILDRAKARRRELRTNGILGANRPELGHFLGQIARAEDRLVELRRAVAEAESEVARLLAERAALDAEMADLEARYAEVSKRLAEPEQLRTSFVVPLSQKEIEFLAANRSIVEQGTFQSAMQALGRLPEYHERTMEVIGKNRILFLPVVNYRMAFQTAALLPPAVLGTLAQHGFARFDSAGNASLGEDQLWMIMAMLSSLPDNVDRDKVAGRSFKEIVERHLARRAEVRIVPSKSKRFEVAIHAWMVGLQIAPIAPGYPPRLRELEWLSPEYDKLARSGDVLQHHAFLFGDPLAFSDLAGVAVDRTSFAATNARVTQFWSDYTPVDAAGRWAQLSPLLAEAITTTEALVERLDAVPHAAAPDPEEPPLETSHQATLFGPPRGSNASAGSSASNGSNGSNGPNGSNHHGEPMSADPAFAEGQNAALLAAEDAMRRFAQAALDGSDSLPARLATLVQQIESTRARAPDATKSVALRELVEETLAVLSVASARLRGIAAGSAAPAQAIHTGAFATLTSTPPTPSDTYVSAASQRAKVREDARKAHAREEAADLRRRLAQGAADALLLVEELHQATLRTRELLRAGQTAIAPAPAPRAAPPLFAAFAPPVASNGAHSIGAKPPNRVAGEEGPEGLVAAHRPTVARAPIAEEGFE